MNNQPDNQHESLWRRKLSKAEAATLCGQPERELEARLTEALAKISDAPVPSNFTARVLSALDLEDARAARLQGWHWNWRPLLPRVAVTAAVLLFAGVGLQHYHQVSSQHAALVKTVALVAETPPLPNVDALENLDAIQRMGRSAHADGELLAALQ